MRAIRGLELITPVPNHFSRSTIQPPNVALDAFIDLYHAQASRFGSRIDDALELLVNYRPKEYPLPLPDDMPTGLRVEIIRFLISCYLEKKQYLEAIQAATQLALLGGILPNSIKSQLIHSALSPQDREEIHSSEYTCTLLAILGVEPKRIYPVLDNFLHINGISSIEAMMEFSTPLKDTILELACITPLLARSPRYQSTLEVEAARIKICQYLIKKQHSTQKLTAEIAELTQKQLIRKGVTNVRRSKIYVDESGIRRAGDSVFREKFQQFISSKSDRESEGIKLFDMDQLSLYLPNDTGELVPKLVDAENLQNKNVRILSHGHYLLFKAFFNDVRNQFAGSNSHGLDSYLSIRIRHGTLQRQMRSPFESLRLLLQRRSPTQGYAENDYWRIKLGLQILDQRRSILHQHLSRFSAEIDRIILELKDTVIHVTTEEKKKPGLLDYAYTEADLLDLLGSRFENVSNHEQFLDRAFSELWQRTLLNLSKVRDFIRNETAQRMRESLEAFELQLRELFPTDEAQELLQNVTKAYAALSITVDIVADWFQPSSQATPEALDVKVIAEIAVASCRNIYPQRTTHYSISAEETHQFHGRVCTPIYDVVAVLLDNAFAHSQMDTIASEVRVAFWATPERFKITVSNRIGEALSAKTVAERINKLSSSVQAEPSGDEMKLEGGTGLPKLFKILRHDLARSDFEVCATDIYHDTIMVSVDFEVSDLTL